MEITPFKIEVLKPPQDDLLSKIKKSDLTLEEGDVVALSSKVVAIHQGRCVPYDRAHKDDLIKAEADFYLDRNESPYGAVIHTIKDGILIPSSGIDPFAGYYILWPERLEQTATELLEWFKAEYKVSKLYLILTDSRSVFLRRGVVGIALAWAGFNPLHDTRLSHGVLGEVRGGSQTNLPDALAASAVLVMGESNEQTPVVRLRNVPYIGVEEVAHKPVFNSFKIPKEEDIFAPFLKVNWKKGK
jgi:F420-0:gamma-glutamyl ligase